MQKSVFRILLSATFVLLIGISISYYNTASLGYDNANVFSLNNEEINIFDYRIEYESVKQKTQKIKDFVSNNMFTI